MPVLPELKNDAIKPKLYISMFHTSDQEGCKLAIKHILILKITYYA